MPPISLDPPTGRHLSFAEREEMAVLRARECGVREIARQLKRSASTISRELRRNAATLQEWPIASEQPWAPRGERVHVCENPQVVQAAVRAGTTRPILCTSGNPATVATLALDKLVSDGVEVVYHGDFDTVGLRIAGRLFNRGLHPWRFSDQDYLEALSSTDASSTLALTGELPETPWSPGLSSAMRSHGRAVHEEAIMELLLHDLA